MDSIFLVPSGYFGGTRFAGVRSGPPDCEGTPWPAPSGLSGSLWSFLSVTVAIPPYFQLISSLQTDPIAEHARRDLNPQPAALETAALPIELLAFNALRA